KGRSLPLICHMLNSRQPRSIMRCAATTQYPLKAIFSLPLGTFKGKDTLVTVRILGGELVISCPEDTSEICRHALPAGRGNKVINTDHKRDKAASVREMVGRAA